MEKHDYIVTLINGYASIAVRDAIPVVNEDSALIFRRDGVIVAAFSPDAWASVRVDECHS